MQLKPEMLTLLEEYFRRREQLEESECEQLRVSLVSQFSALANREEISNADADTFLKELYLCVRDHWRNQNS